MTFQPPARGLFLTGQDLAMAGVVGAHAAQVLSRNLTLTMALPCRISIYQEGGKTKIGLAKPTALLAIFSDAEALKSVAEEVK